MRQKRKTRAALALFVATLLLAIGICPTGGFAASPATIALGQASASVRPGDEFTVPVTIADNPGFAAASLELNYNHTALEVVGIRANGALAAGDLHYDFARTDTVGYVNRLLVDITGNGVLFNVTFRVKTAATAGTYDYAVGLYASLANNFVNKDLETVPVSFQSGSVQIVAGSTGGAGTGGTGTGGTGTGGTGTSGGGAGTTNNTNPPGTNANATDNQNGSGTGSSGSLSGNNGSGNTDTGATVPDIQTPVTDGPQGGFDISDLPWGWILLAVVLLAGAFIFFLINRRRKDEDED